MFDNFGGDACDQRARGYITCYYSTCGYDGFVAYGHAIDDCHVGHYPHAIADVDRFYLKWIYFFQRCLCRDASMGGDGAPVANGSVVTNGDLLWECTVEEHVVADVNTFADMYAAPAVH